MARDELKSYSRRDLLLGSALALGASLCGPAAAQQKIAPQLVQYQSTPKGDQSCASCLHFEAPRGCRLVAGDIDPKAWCAIYAAKPR